MKSIYSELAQQTNSFDISIGVKIPFFRVPVTIEPDRSLVTVLHHELFDYSSKYKQRSLKYTILWNLIKQMEKVFN